MQKVAITLTVKDLFDNFFMAKYFTYCESKSTAKGINQKIQSPDSMVVSPNNCYLSLNGFGKLGTLDDTMKSRRIEY